MKYYVVDAFANDIFQGNPAGVCVLEERISEEIMQKIAIENNLSETAFVYRITKGEYDLKWFTPAEEIDLCGHATLGTAYVIANYVDEEIDCMKFYTLSGELNVRRYNDLYELDFPTRMPKPVEITSQIKNLTNFEIKKAFLARDLMIVLNNEEEVQNFIPSSDKIKELPIGKGLIITAPGNEVDFVSRCFYPKLCILEDPVTGSAHSNLIPYWTNQLAKDEVVAKQISQRGGTLWCRIEGERVKISGKAALYLQGNIYVE